MIDYYLKDGVFSYRVLQTPIGEAIVIFRPNFWAEIEFLLHFPKYNSMMLLPPECTCAIKKINEHTHI